MKETKEYFTKDFTQYIKGIAVLLLLAHHLFWRQVELPLQYSTANLNDYITPLTKVCVTIFTVLSGFGMAKSWNRYNKKTGNNGSFRFVSSHIKKLIFNYWWIYVPAFVLSFLFHINGTPLDIYGRNMKGLIFFFLDFIGMRVCVYSPTLNNTWWYMELILVCYFLFPVFMRIINSCYGGWLLAIITGIISFWGTKEITGIEVQTDRELFYFFSFVVGILMQKYEVLDRFIDFCKDKKRNMFFVTAGSLVCCMMLRTQIGLIADMPYALSLIALGTLMKVWGQDKEEQVESGFLEGTARLCQRVLEFLGRHSMNIFLIHSFVYCYFGISAKFILGLPGCILRYIALLGLSVLGSVMIEFLKKKIGNIWVQ